MLSAGSIDRAGHVVQLFAPVVLSYFPAVHARHVAPLGPVYPALQMQADTTVLPAGALEQEERLELPDGELELAGQLEQRLELALLE